MTKRLKRAPYRCHRTVFFPRFVTVVRTTSMISFDAIKSTMILSGSFAASNDRLFHCTHASVNFSRESENRSFQCAGRCFRAHIFLLLLSIQWKEACRSQTRPYCAVTKRYSTCYSTCIFLLYEKTSRLTGKNRFFSSSSYDDLLLANAHGTPSRTSGTRPMCSCLRQ